MADFETAFARLAKDEGTGLSNDPADKGKQTFFGISRKFHPRWEGWSYVDRGETPPTESVRSFYRANYWIPVHGDQIESQPVAEALFSQFVNMGSNGIKLAQQCVGVIPDGKVGPKTLAAINSIDPGLFLLMYCVANVKRYHAIGMMDKTQRKFWPGWFSRSLRLVEAA